MPIPIPLPPITRSLLAQIHGLRQRKRRTAVRKFVVEGGKSVLELLKDSRWKVDCMVVQQEGPATLCQIEERLVPSKIYIASIGQMAEISQLTTPPQILAVVHQPPPRATLPHAGKLLALAGLQDPGNLGTILRIADWYGLAGVVCDDCTVDLYSAKVVQASMGSFLRVPVWYTCLRTYLEQTPLPILVAGMEGGPYAQTPMPKEGVFVFGNEGQGLPHFLEQGRYRQLTIPRYGQAESLNVAVAVGILVNHWYA